MRITISEKQVLDAIASVLMENRKVLKVGNSAPSTPPAPSPDMGMPMQDPMGGMGAGDIGPSGGPGDPGVMDPSMEDPNAMGGDMGGDNQFDTNFDAGVEADEETDPKHYIQQLTGKLSQSLNSFNSEQGPDAGLSKYVASMIISAACKNLDEKAKKELIEKINSASSDEEDMGDEEMPDDSGAPEDMGGDEAPMGNGQEMQQQQPMMEKVLTKKELLELAFGLNGSDERQENMKSDNPKGKRSIFCGKPF